MRFFSLFICLVFIEQIFAQDICYKTVVDKSFLINFEGHFINNEKSRTHIDISWRHNEETPDSFYVYLPGKRSFLFISTKDYRVLWIQPENVKRQLATHHLKEKIGTTPLYWDDLELLANGSFFCQDSNAIANNIFATAYSQTWYSLVFDNQQSPTKIRMRGNRGLSRNITIHSWKKFSDVLLPSILEITSSESSGSLWIRSAYPIKTKVPMDPLLKSAQSKNGKRNPFLFPRAERERKMPLILQMDKELLQ